MNMYKKAINMNQVPATVNSNRKNKIRVSLFLAILLLLPLFVRSPYLLHVMIITALYIILAAALRLPLITGRFNIGIVAFAAIGAYTSALLASKLGVNVWLALLAGCAVSGVVAFGLGLIILRVSGLYFAMLTMCLLEMLRHYLLWHRKLTGGVMGILNIPSPTIWGFDLGADKVPFYYLTMIVMVFSIWFIYRMERSRAGMAFQAIGQSDLLSEHLGINIARYRNLAFVVSGIFAGLMGGMIAHYLHYTSPEDWTIMQSLTIQIFMVVGGRGSPWGPIVGTVVLMAISEILRPTKEVLPLVYGAILIPVILFYPRGIVGFPHSISQWWSRRGQPRFSASR
jgi:branched-chain amino acid transport system permease protein